MKPTEFVRQIDETRLIAAIGEAELRTSGELRVYISHREHPDALGAAQKRFHQLGMTKTAERNAVLLYLVPRSRTFAIIGDAGIHAKCGQNFWEQTRTQLSADLKTQPITDALVNAIAHIGERLSAHFPRREDDRNELPNQIEHD